MVPAIDDVATSLLAADARLGRARLLCVDGPAGSGKTTLAEAVSRELAARVATVEVVHLDDLYAGWTGLDADLEARILAQLLVPLSEGRPARWQRYDWHAGRFAEWHDLEVPDVLVVEGCGSGARSLDPYRSLLVWIEAPPDTRVSRGIARDGEQVRDQWMAWTELEQRHFAANDTRARADVVLEG